MCQRLALIRQRVEYKARTTYVDGYVRTIQFYYLSIESVVSSLRVGKTGGGAGAGYGDGRMGQVPPPSQPPLRNDYYGAIVPSSAQGHGAYGHSMHYDTHPSQYNAPPPPSSYGGNSGYGPPACHPSVSGGGAGAYGGGQYQQQQPLVIHQCRPRTGRVPLRLHLPARGRGAVEWMTLLNSHLVMHDTAVRAEGNSDRI